MVLMEGISDEVLVAFIVTILVSLVALFYIFTNERNNHNGNGRRSENRSANHGNTNTSVGTSATNGQATVNTMEYETVNTEEETTQGVTNRETSGSAQQSASLSANNLRRRGGASTNVDNEENVQESTMLVKVKHNENVQSFNVSNNCTVLELKRLAFFSEMNAGKRVRFVFAGQLLRNDGDALTAYGVQDNTVVHCVITDQPAQTEQISTGQEEDVDLSRFLIPLLTAGLIFSWYGLITYKHIFTGPSIAILMFLTCLYFVLVYVTTIQ